MKRPATASRGGSSAGCRTRALGLRRRASVQLGQLHAAHALVVALHGRSLLALALGGGLFVELAGARRSVSRPSFSMVRLKRRRATSNGSFSLTRMVVIDFLRMRSVFGNRVGPVFHREPRIDTQGLLAKPRILSGNPGASKMLTTREFSASAGAGILVQCTSSRSPRSWESNGLR